MLSASNDLTCVLVCRCQISFSHQRWASIPHSVKDLIGWMCCKQPAKRCAAVQALTHPWFQRIARPLCKAAAVSTAAAEESDRATNLQHKLQQQRDREPLSLVAGDTHGDTVEPIGKGLDGLSLHPKDADTAEADKGPSFFNSAPPGAPGVKGSQQGLSNIQSTESQRNLLNDKPPTVRGFGTMLANHIAFGRSCQPVNSFSQPHGLNCWLKQLDAQAAAV